MTDENANAGGTDNTGAGSGSGTGTPTFLDTLPEALRGNEAFKDVSDAGTLAQRYLDTLGKIPKAPEKPDEYPAIEDLNPEFTATFREVAHKAGLTVEQATALNSMFKTQLEKSAEAEQQAIKVAEQKQQAMVDALKKEWGPEFDKKVAKANNVLTALGLNNAGFLALLKETGLGNHPEMLKVFHQIGEQISESALKNGRSAEPTGRKTMSDGMTPQLDYPTDYSKQAKA